MSFEKLIAHRPERVIKLAVKGMMPRNPLGRAMQRKLKVYAGSAHPHVAQQPQQLTIAGMMMVYLVRRLTTGHTYLLSIDDNDVIAGINVWSVFRLVLTSQATGNLCSQTTERQRHDAP
jgi:ribosomal protein L13